MNAVPLPQVLTTPAEAPASSVSSPTRRRHNRRRRESRRLTKALCAVGMAVVLLVVYVFFCANATRHSYQHSRLQARLLRLEAERKLLEAQVADRQRIDRILVLAKAQGMQPRQALEYVVLALPQAPPRTREFQQASARP